jgi:hypothetical protein
MDLTRSDLHALLAKINAKRLAPGSMTENTSP